MKFKPFQQLASALIFCEDRLFGLLTTASHRLVFRVNPFLTIVYIQFMSLGVRYHLPHPKHIILGVLVDKHFHITKNKFTGNKTVHFFIS